MNVLEKRVSALITALAEVGEPLTYREIEEYSGVKMSGAVFAYARSNDYIRDAKPTKVEREVVRKVNTYVIVSAEPVENRKYSDRESAIIAALAAAGKPLTLADVNELVEPQFRPLCAGTISGIAKAGNIKCAGKAEVKGIARVNMPRYALTEAGRLVYQYLKENGAEGN